MTNHDPSYKSYLIQLALKSLGYSPGPIDNWWGSHTEAAYNSFLKSQESPYYSVIASTFADPADVARFKHCKELGGTDQECFKVGDNGVGAWGDDTTTSEPQVALPPEVITDKWGTVDAGHNQRISLSYRDHAISARVTDKMPHLAHIPTQARIDLNPGAVTALAIPKGGMVRVEWKWL